MGQDLINDLLIFDTTVRRIGNYLYGTSAMSTRLRNIVTAWEIGQVYEMLKLTLDSSGK